MNCLEYGGKTYKPENLFEKIRKNPVYFTKKHGITGRNIEQVLGIQHQISTENDIQYQSGESPSLNNLFNTELKQLINGTLPTGHIFKMGMPNDILRSAGLPNLPIEMSATRLKNKSKQDNHPFDLSEVENLPNAIQNPIAVFDSTKGDETKIILTELHTKNGNNYVVAMRVSNRGDRKNKIEINSIKSIYPKDHFTGVLDWINSPNNLMKYADTKKLLDYISVQSTNLIANGNTNTTNSQSRSETNIQNKIKIAKQKATEWLGRQQSNSADATQLSNRSVNIIKNFQNTITKNDLDYQFLSESDFDTNGNVRPEVLEEIKAEKENIIKQAQANGTFMKAPNGQDTNLTQEQWVSVRTQRFKKWFGDWEQDPENASKVVDENGEPKEVSHSTNHSFREFIHTQKTDAGWLGKGYYFFGDRSLDGQYGKNVMPVFLNIREPYYITDEEYNELVERDDNDFSNDFTEDLKLQGYDGVFNNINLNEEWNAFYPNQIKDSYDNIGTYSNLNDNIDFQLGNNNQPKFIPPHQNVLPQKDTKEISNIYRETRDIDQAFDYLQNTHWYNKLDDAEKSQITKDNLANFMFEQLQKQNENKEARQKWNEEQQQIAKEQADDDYRNAQDLDNKTGAELLAEARARREQAEKELSEKHKKTFKARWRDLIKGFSDRQFEVKTFLKHTGMLNTYNRIIAMAGASSRANAQFKQAEEKIFKGLSQKDKKDLEEIIRTRRNIAIDENRQARGLGQIRHSGGHTIQHSEKILQALKDELGENKFNDLNQRATEYFNTFRDILTAMKDSGIISQQQYEAMVDIDYQPRIFIQHLLDADGNLMEKSDAFQQSGKLSQDAIKSLSEGSFDEQLMNAEWILKLALSSRSSQLAMNDVNKTFATRDYPNAKRKYDRLKNKSPYDLTKEEKKFIQFFEELESKVKFPAKQSDPTPKGYQKAYYYENGERQHFFMKEDFYNEWHDLNKGIFQNSKLKSGIAKWSGSKIVKNFATGVNPVFMIANTPRDFGNIVLFSSEYSNFLPLANLQLIKDTAKGIKELIKDDRGQKDTLVSKYIEYGGGMDFLHTQGMIERDNLISRTLDNILSPKNKEILFYGIKTASLLKLSRYSEQMFRIGVFHRSLKNQLKEFNKLNGTNYTDVEQIPNETTKRDIYIQAVVSARSILDFNQGGTYTKDLEAFLPYINTGVQGTRVMVDAFIQRPKETSARVLQAGGFLATLGFGLSALLFALGGDDEDEDKIETILNAYEGISTHQRINYINIILPNKLENGEHRVIKIAKTQAIAPIAYFMEEVLLNIFRKEENKISWGEIMKNTVYAFNTNLSPIDLPTEFNATGFAKAGGGTISRNPLAKAILTGTLGYDFFRDQPLDKTFSGKNLPLELEGIRNDKVEDFYKAIAKVSGDSPIRMKAMVESVITSPDNNMWLGLIYGGLEGAVSDKTFKEIFADDGGIMLNTFLRRMKSETSDFNRILKIKERNEDTINAMIVAEEEKRMLTDKLVNQYIAGEKTAEQVKTELKKISSNKNEYDKILNRVKNKAKNKDTDPKIWDIKYSTGSSAKAKAFLIHKYFPNLRNQKDIQKQLKQNGLLTDEIKKEYNKLNPKK